MTDALFGRHAQRHLHTITTAAARERACENETIADLLDAVATASRTTLTTGTMDERMRWTPVLAKAAQLAEQITADDVVVTGMRAALPGSAHLGRILSLVPGATTGQGTSPTTA